MEPKLPPDGTEVVAMTWGSEYMDTPPCKVRGKLWTRYVSALDYVQCDVEGKGGWAQVDGRTVRRIKGDGNIE